MLRRSRNFELVLNLPATQAIGVDIPPSVPLRAERLVPVVASALSLPSFTCGMPETMLSNSTCTLFDTRSGMASAVPR